MSEPADTGGGWTGPRAIAALVVVLGLLAAAAQFVLARMRDDVVERELAHLRTIGDARVALAESHLWMEELVSGEAQVRGRIAEDLGRATRAVAALLDGAAADRPAQRLRPVTDPRLRVDVEAFAADVAAFASMTERRVADHARGADVGVGTSADVDYDHAFAELSAGADRLRERIAERVDAAMLRTRNLSRALLGVWGAAVVLALLGLARLERTRAARERAVRERDTQAAQAQKLEAVGRLATGLAHDINNYLAVVVAQCGLVLRKPPSADDPGASVKLQRRMSDVLVTANRAAAMIRRLLSFSRTAPAEPQALRIDDALREAEPVLRQLIGEANRLELDTGDGLSALADPIEFEQLLINLAVNAREAMPQGGRLRVAARGVHLSEEDARRLRIPRAPGDYVRITVEDEGSGIAPEALARIFEPYYTSKSPGGLGGIGLATVYGILQRSGGSIAVDSAPGRGTRFRIYLPAAGRG